MTNQRIPPGPDRQPEGYALPFFQFNRTKRLIQWARKRAGRVA